MWRVRRRGGAGVVVVVCVCVVVVGAMAWEPGWLSRPWPRAQPQRLAELSHVPPSLLYLLFHSAGSVLHLLMDFLSDSNTASALDVVFFIREIVEVGGGGARRW